ncbi:glycosyltransferase family 4 protein [Flavobacterium sp. TAB 87]|uniref:glycosyltransferase family 4 protein n=1 Tax=Flavobacterium sp. TAB 87 TaxID=1729581 RepID=UPI00076DF296|nr:glycosyltransferase family 4 protein [Flavobacterium sp. TAB 87]KVV15887.1 Glycogen synthase [Flavobacterium sp. TAB 87]
MHIGFITPEYPHPRVRHAAGLGTSVYNLVKALVKQEIVVSVFIYGQSSDVVFEEDGVHFYLIADKKYRFAKWFLYRKYIQTYVNKIVSLEKINILEAPDWTGITAFMKFKVPLVIRFHGSDTYFCHLEQRKQKLKNFWFEKLAVSGANAFVAPTAFAGNLSQQLFKIKNKKIETIHYGLDLLQFENTTPDEFENGLILYVGTIIRKKGVLELSEIFAKVRQQCPNAHLVLIGSDAADIKTQSSSTWELLIKQFPKDDLNHIQYLGKVAYDEVQNYIKNANVCVFPTFAETLGMVTIESMAMQKAVVNSNIGWAKELIVDEESGYLVHPEYHGLYAQRIIDVLKNDLLCLEIGKRARIRVEQKFDIDAIAIHNIKYYEEIILSFRQN